MELNRVIIGDNLPIMRGMPDKLADLIYLDPPFNSGVDYETEEGAFKDKWGKSDVDAVEIDALNQNHPKVFKVIDLTENDLYAYLTFMAARLIELRRLLKDTGSIYLHCDSTASHYLKLLMDAIFGRKLFKREIIWANNDNSGLKSTAKNWIRGSDTILFYTKTKDFTFNKIYTKPNKRSLQAYNKRDDKGVYKTYKLPDGGVRKHYYDPKGVPMPSVWSDIASFQTIGGHRGEYLKYPTQKPEKLLDRIIRASSNEGDLVFDPFAGSGTTLAVAYGLDRKYLGCDLNSESAELLEKRIKSKAHIEGSML